MRLDKYLKNSRIIKRRTLAKELLDLNRVKINGKTAKPSTNVNVDDILEIELKDKLLTVKVKEIKENVTVAQALDLFEVIKEEKIIREL